MTFPPSDSSQPIDALEKELLAIWKRERLFTRVSDATRYGPPFIFFEGPPTANGRPGIHHVFARTLKDVVCRQRLMAGFRVPRKAGLKAVELFDAVRAGRVKAVWIMATNPVASLPNADAVRAALAACELSVVSEAVRARDPTGAGDSFATAYLAARSGGAAPTAAARRAAALVSDILSGRAA